MTSEEAPLLNPKPKLASHSSSSSDSAVYDAAVATAAYDAEHADTVTGTLPALAKLGTVEAFGILISIVIGSGIFTSPGAIDANVPSPAAALGIWLAGGLLAWMGAGTMAELGTAIGGEGGIQPYLQYIYGDIVGFLAAWTWLLAVMPATLAILSIVFIDTLLSASAAGANASWAVRKTLSIAVLCVFSLANCISTRATTTLNAFFVATKFATIIAVVLAGIAVLVCATPGFGGDDWRARSWLAPRALPLADGGWIDWTRLSAWEALGHYSAALYAALWAYSGWDKVVYVSAEMGEPARQLPAAINMALPTIIACFMAANAAYYVLLPWAEISATDSIAVTAVARLAGPVVGLLISVMIGLVIAGSLLGNSFVAGRMGVSAANKNWMPRPLSHLSRLSLPFSAPSAAPGDVPVVSIGMATALATVYILLGDFRALVTFNGLGEFTFFFLTVSGAVILRVREPALARPYKPPIVVPLGFTMVSGFVVVRGATFAPAQAAVLGGLWVVGVVYYVYRQQA
ncbi:hypothetical protein TD95_003534 [Thielaviopsis punctulata]|uniref:Amino acid permease/ SLC12A domain-containing protein n=1 Tax=Thielaviopsis punctulata TaxID=72032 RepID=A0A0F4ZGC3_9PEZI|nr:hypothetical protein TD95_003534 [Thielaviopsis punctulata]